MSIGVHTNSSALIALQNLNSTADQLTQTQERISTGLNISSAKDNASVWAIAQGQRADIGALGAVKMSLDRATSISDVAATAGQSISDLLVQMKQKVVAGMDPSLDTASRTALNNDYQSLLKQVQSTMDNAEFDGANLLNGSITNNVQFIANADGSQTITLSVKDMTLGGSIITMGATSSITTVAAASLVLGQLDASITNVNTALGQMGSDANQISTHEDFVSKLMDVLTTGVGKLVDADMAKESAQLQALQAQQQLGVEALSIANSAPQIVLQLFK